MATRIHRPLKVIAFNANAIVRQRYVLSKQLQDLHVDVALFSETSEIATFIEPTATRADKAELPLRLEEAFPMTI
jgi:hypothetical protein